MTFGQHQRAKSSRDESGRTAPLTGTRPKFKVTIFRILIHSNVLIIIIVVVNVIVIFN